MVFSTVDECVLVMAVHLVLRIVLGVIILIVEVSVEVAMLVECSSQIIDSIIIGVFVFREVVIILIGIW